MHYLVATSRKRPTQLSGEGMAGEVMDNDVQFNLVQSENASRHIATEHNGSGRIANNGARGSMMKKALVTGAGGFVAGHLVERLKPTYVAAKCRPQRRAIESWPEKTPAAICRKVAEVDEGRTI
jgi:hypothetical protein